MTKTEILAGIGMTEGYVYVSPANKDKYQILIDLNTSIWTHASAGNSYIITLEPVDHIDYVELFNKE